jgi:hypothetical protein
VKNRGSFMGASYNAEGTFFRAQTADTNYDLTNQISYNNVYHSWGLEADGGLRWGNFMLTADVTYTHAVIAKDATGPTTGNTPLATPKFIYLFSPTYDTGFAAVGVACRSCFTPFFCTSKLRRRFDDRNSESPSVSENGRLCRRRNIAWRRSAQ